MFVTSTADVTYPENILVLVEAKDESDIATVFTISAHFIEANLKASGSGEKPGLNPQNVNFIQTEELTTAGIAVQKYGGLIIPASKVGTDITLVAEINGTTYTATSTINGSTPAGATVTLNKG